MVLAILRDAEHRKNPLAPAPHPDDDEKAMKSDDGSDNEPEDKDSIKMDTSSAGSKEKRENLVDKLSHAGQKGKHGTKVKARKAWDRLGKAKEEVRAGQSRPMVADAQGFAIIAGHKQLDVQGKAEVHSYLCRLDLAYGIASFGQTAHLQGTQDYFQGLGSHAISVAYGSW